LCEEWQSDSDLRSDVSLGMIDYVQCRQTRRHLEFRRIRSRQGVRGTAVRLLWRALVWGEKPIRRAPTGDIFFGRTMNRMTTLGWQICRSPSDRQKKNLCSNSLCAHLIRRVQALQVPGLLATHSRDEQAPHRRFLLRDFCLSVFLVCMLPIIFLTMNMRLTNLLKIADYCDCYTARRYCENCRGAIISPLI